MAEPLPDAEWWPLKFSPETDDSYPGYDFQFRRRGRWRCVIHYTDAQGGDDYKYGVWSNRVNDPGGYLLAKCDDLLTLRCLLLKLAYPGGNYG